MSHLTKEQRYTICTMLHNGYTQSEIARVIKKDKSVVSRELRRNADARSGQYKDDLAHRKYLKHQQYKAKHRTFTPEVAEYVRDKLRLKYSLEQIAGVAKINGDKCVLPWGGDVTFFAASISNPDASKMEIYSKYFDGVTMFGNGLKLPVPSTSAFYKVSVDLKDGFAFVKLNMDGTNFTIVPTNNKKVTITFTAL